MLGYLLGAVKRWFPTALPGGRAPAEKRRHVRYRIPTLTLTIEGHRYKTVDWSLGGFRIAGFHRPVAPGSTLRGVIAAIDSSGAGEFAAQVAHSSAENGVGLRILEIAPAMFVAMGELKTH